MTIKNVSQLAITTNIRIENPFYIQQDNNKVNMIEKHLENEDVLSINIEFVPKATKEESITWNRELIFTYLGHPHKVPLLYRQFCFCVTCFKISG